MTGFVLDMPMPILCACILSCDINKHACIYARECLFAHFENNAQKTAAGNIVEPAVHAWIMDQSTHSRNILGNHGCRCFKGDRNV